MRTKIKRAERFRRPLLMHQARSRPRWAATRIMLRWGGAIGLANVMLHLLGESEVLLRFPFSVVWIVPYCLGSALVAGLVVDLMRPFARTRLGGAMVGFVASLPVSLGYLLVAARDVLAMKGGAAKFLLLMGLTYGLLVGALYWKEPE